MSVSAYLPTVHDVALLLRARTRNAAGDLVRDFTDDTTPTAEDVQGLIELAAANVGGAIGLNVPREFLDSARSLVVYLAAANVELSYWPEQASAAGSMYDKLMERYNAKLAQLQEDISDIVDGDEDDGVDGNWNTLGGGFPSPYWWRYERW